jgi:hypothetical protein
LIRADVAGLRDELAIEADALAGWAARFLAMPMMMATYYSPNT